MNNIVDGVLKVRGKWQDIKTFILNEVKIGNNNQCITEADTLCYFNISDNKLSIKPYKNSWLFINNKDNIYFNCIEIMNNGFGEQDYGVIPLGNIKCNCIHPWKMDTSELEKYSKKYNIDFRIFAFCSDSNYKKEIIIEHGNVIKTNYIVFN